jgi:hypothetical protein
MPRLCVLLTELRFRSKGEIDDVPIAPNYEDTFPA